MKFIMRHAETAEGWPDKSRNLTAKGVEDAKKAAAWLKSRRVTTIISSGASRSIETAKVIGEVLGISPTVREDLYSAPAQRLVDATGEGILVIAHNPGCENSYELMTGKWGPRFEPCTIGAYGRDKVEIFTP